MPSRLSTLLTLLVFITTLVQLTNAGTSLTVKKHKKRCKACNKNGNTNTNGGNTNGGNTSSDGNGGDVNVAQAGSSATTASPSSPPSGTSRGGRKSKSSSASSFATVTAAIPSSSATNTGSGSGNGSSTTTGSGKVYTVTTQYKGQSFFDGFDFETFSDPTHGLVNYVDQATAQSQNLAYVDGNGNFVMKVDNTGGVDSSGRRNSVRIQSKQSFTSGLLVADFETMPYGCSTWPAFWTVGDNWPNGGEIDIVEGVNNADSNQYTLHTSSGCSASSSSSSKRRRDLDTPVSSGKAEPRHRSTRRRHAARANSNITPSDDTSPLASGRISYTGTLLATDCDANANGNAGCGIVDNSQQSYGAGLVNAGGAVFAMLLDDQNGIAVWSFPKASVPADLAAGTPQPAGWGSPVAYWSSNTCPTSQFFGAQTIVINTTLCGDWAGAVFASSGCPGTCQDYVANASNFDNAVWTIRSVTLYN